MVSPGELHRRRGATTVVLGQDGRQSECIGGQVGTTIGVGRDQCIPWAGHLHRGRRLVVEVDELLEHVGVAAVVLEGVSPHVEADRLHAPAAERGVEEGHRHLAAAFVEHFDVDVLFDHLIAVLLTGHFEGRLTGYEDGGRLVHDRDGLLGRGGVAAVVHESPGAVDTEAAGAELGVNAVLLP